MESLSEVKSLLLTGANGFVGRSIVEKLASLNRDQLPNEIVLVTRNGIQFELPKEISTITNVVQQDLTQKWTIDFESTHIINLAADGSRSSYSDNANEVFRVIGNKFAEWIEFKKITPRVFHASSGACFGYSPLSPIQPANNLKENFIQSRIDIENLLKTASESGKFQLTIGRLFTFAGTNLLRKDQYAVTDFIYSGLKNGIVHVKGDPGTIRSYMHQSTMAEWILQSIVIPECPEDLQIGSSEKVSIGELAEYVAELTGSEVNYSDFPQAGDVYLPNIDSTRAKLGLGEGMHWKSAVLEMINEAKLEIHDHNY